MITKQNYNAPILILHYNFQFFDKNIKHSRRKGENYVLFFIFWLKNKTFLKFVAKYYYTLKRFRVKLRHVYL